MSEQNDLRLSDDMAALDDEWRSHADKGRAIRELVHERLEGRGAGINVVPAVRSEGKTVHDECMALEEVATDWECAVGPVVGKLLAIPAESWSDLLAQLEGLIEWSIDPLTDNAQENYIIGLPGQIRRLLEAE